MNDVAGRAPRPLASHPSTTGPCSSRSRLPRTASTPPASSRAARRAGRSGHGRGGARGGSYRGESAAEAARLLKLADRGQVLIDDPTAVAIDGRLPPEIGLAEVRATHGAAGVGARCARPVDPAARPHVSLPRADGLSAGRR